MRDPGPPSNPMAASDARAALEALIDAECSAGVNPDVEFLAKALAAKPGVQAIVFYGSGLWLEAGADTLYDFYVLVDRYRDCSSSLLLAGAGNILPPNVYYMETPGAAGVLRCKVAVLRLSQFRSAARGRSFTPHIWARFCQPCRLLEARNERVHREVVSAIADAVVQFHRQSLPLVDSNVSLEEFWITGLRATYASELRPEDADRATRLVQAHRDAFAQRSRFALALCGDGARLTADVRVLSSMAAAKRRLLRRWTMLKRPVQKAVPLGRLIKAAFTFSGGLDYARWKIERHSGVSIELTDFQRRHPLLGGMSLLWKVLRRGGIH